MSIESTPATVQPAIPPKGRGIADLILIGAVVIAIGGVAFAIGRLTAPASALPAGFPGGAISIEPGGSLDPGDGPVFRGAGPGGFGGDGPTISGTVASIDADGITLTLPSGDTATIKVDDSTTYRTANDATAADVSVGDTVDVEVDADALFRGGAGASAAPDLTASDVTVER